MIGGTSCETDLHTPATTDHKMTAAVNALLGSVIGIIGLALAFGLVMTMLNMVVWADRLLPRSM